MDRWQFGRYQGTVKVNKMKIKKNSTHVFITIALILSVLVVATVVDDINKKSDGNEIKRWIGGGFDELVRNLN